MLAVCLFIGGFQCMEGKVLTEEEFKASNGWLKYQCTVDVYIENNGDLSHLQGSDRDYEVERAIMEFSKYTKKPMNIAPLYFRRHCAKCNKLVYDREVLSMSMKLIGRSNNKPIYCKEHLLVIFPEMKNENKWNELVRDLKRRKCGLF